MNFSIVLIAKNESKTLPRLVESLSEFQKRGGEILLLDTGSTDGTADIARSLGCRVKEVGDKFVTVIDKEKAKELNKHFIVKGEKAIVEVGDRLFDYASARNYIADFASTDMIATPDCDEVWTKFDINKIEEAINNGAEQLEYNFVFSHDEFGNEAIKFMHSKFYNKKKMKWVGVVHEVLSGEAKRMFLDESVMKLEHFQNVETNRSGYLRGLALDCFLNPTNDRNSHYLGRELLWTGRPYSAIKELERHITMDLWLPERAQSMVYIGDAHRALGNIEQMVLWYTKAFTLDSSRREAVLRLASYYYQTGDAQKTLMYASMALQIPKSYFYADNQEDYGAYPHELMYWATWQVGDYGASHFHFNKALEYKPEYSKYLHDYRFYYACPMVSIIIPQLGREEGLKKCLDSIKNLNYPQDRIEVIVEEGVGTVPKKVAKGLKKAKGSLIVYAANDIEFTPDSLILAVIESKNKGLVAFDTGVRNAEGFINEHFLIRKDLIEKIGGEIFDTSFHHVGVDDLLWKKCDKLGETTISKGKVHHYHFSRIGSGVEKDYVIEKGWEKEAQDRTLLQAKLKEL
jgi:glycosyltransferase involved in cell wall biosynthesis